MAADILKDDEIELILDMRPGLIQLEIGVQSTNLDTITEIHRKMDFKKVADIVTKINARHRKIIMALFIKIRRHMKCYIQNGCHMRMC